MVPILQKDIQQYILRTFQVAEAATGSGLRNWATDFNNGQTLPFCSASPRGLLGALVWTGRALAGSLKDITKLGGGGKEEDLHKQMSKELLIGYAPIFSSKIVQREVQTRHSSGTNLRQGAGLCDLSPKLYSF